MGYQPKASAEDEKYTVKVMGKNIEITKPIEDYVREKIGKIEQLVDQILDVTVRLDVQKLMHLVDIVIKFGHFRVNVHAKTENLYSAIDKAFEKLKRKLHKWKEKIKDHHAKGVSVMEMEVNVLEGARDPMEDIDEGIIEENNQTVEATISMPKVMKRKSRPLKILNLDEAVMKMELSGDHFMIYRDEEDRQLKVIYRRRDGSYGVISAEG